VRDVIYTYHAYATMSVSVCPSVCDGSALGRGAWRISYHCYLTSQHSCTLLVPLVSSSLATLHVPIHPWTTVEPLGEGSSPGRVEGSSHAMLATARPSCYTLSELSTILASPSCYGISSHTHHTFNCSYRQMAHLATHGASKVTDTGNDVTVTLC